MKTVQTKIPKCFFLFRFVNLKVKTIGVLSHQLFNNKHASHFISGHFANRFPSQLIIITPSNSIRLLARSFEASKLPSFDSLNSWPLAQLFKKYSNNLRSEFCSEQTKAENRCRFSIERCKSFHRRKSLKTLNWKPLPRNENRRKILFLFRKYQGSGIEDTF